MYKDNLTVEYRLNLSYWKDKINDKTLESSAMYWSNEGQNMARTWCIKTNVQKNDQI